MRWQVSPEVSPDMKKEFPDYHRVVLQLLANRGLLAIEAAEKFLRPDYQRDLHSPFLFKDMERAMQRLFEAVSKGERVMIYGDYDADGVCSTVILHQALKGLGLETDYYIPFRETEGYGLNKAAAEKIIREKFQLVITVDCGVANGEEVAMLEAAGINVIILDHHEEPLVLPEAYALINPNVKSCGYPVSRLCGAGVAFKFVQAIVEWQERHDSMIKLPLGFEKWLLDLVAMATIADIVPLIGENRVLVKYGLMVMSKTRNAGLSGLIDSIGNQRGQLDTEFVGWRLVPRINAAGRIDHASAAFYLLTAKKQEEADKWIGMLEENNKNRQQMTETILRQAEAQLKDLSDDNKSIIVVGKNWPVGVVGLAAGRLCDKYHRPTLAFHIDGDKYVASGRSIEEFDITEALKACDDLLLRYGGHPQACGLTIVGEDNFLEFKRRFERLAAEKLSGLKLEKTLPVEAEVRLDELNFELLSDIAAFEPFGEANEKPLFLAKRLRIEQVQTVGADGKHLKVLVSQNGDLKRLHKLIGFSFGDWCAKLKAGDLIDIVFELGMNEWNGNRELQLKIIDLKLSE